jgi:hypothetical protein
MSRIVATRGILSSAAALVVAAALITACGGTVQAAKTEALFRTIQTLSLSAYSSPTLLTADANALFVGVGGNSSANFLRVDTRSLTVAAKASVPDVTSAVFDGGALWVTANTLKELNPTSLTTTAQFSLPEPALFSAIGGGELWVATATALFEINPATGQTMRRVSLDFLPYALAGSRSDPTIYVLGDRQPSGPAVLAAYSTSTGHQLAERMIGAASVGPIAVTAEGVWVPDQEPKTGRTTIKFYKGATLTLRAQLPKRPFDTGPYYADGALWLIDGAGRADTVCANPVTGGERKSGPPVGVGLAGEMLTSPTATYLLHHTARGDELLKIRPISACSS